MKKPFLFISVVFVLNISIVLFLTLQAQWHNLNSPIKNNGFKNIHFINNSVGYVVGGDPSKKPIILKTTNGGKTFKEQNIDAANKVFDVYPFSQNITDVYPIDENIAYVCGNFGLVAKTIDGGKNWVIQDFPNEDHLMSTSFINKDIGYIAGGGGTIAKTIDGGLNWRLLESGITRRLWDIVFINPDTGFVCGDPGKILRTVNGGSSWHHLPTNNINKESIFELNFPSSQIGYGVTLTGKIIKTTNGGNSWTVLKTISTSIRGIAFSNNLSGTVCGNGGLILNTTDGGITWAEQKISSSEDKYAIHFVQNVNQGFSEAYTVGENGSIMKYKKPLKIEDPNLLAALLENFNPSLLKFSFVLNPSFMFK